MKFSRHLCNNLSISQNLEWLVTNGVGSYASGTVSGALTRGYHGALVAALEPPLGRTLLLAKLEETVVYDKQTFSLSTNHWQDQHVDPRGYIHLQQFQLDGTMPVWTFVVQDALLEKRIWMKQGENTTYVLYRYLRGSCPLTISIKALCNYRDYHSRTSAYSWTADISKLNNGLQISVIDKKSPFFLFANQGKFDIDGNWYTGFYLSEEAYRGLDAIDNHIHAGTLNVQLSPGKTLAFIASTEINVTLDGEAEYLKQRAYEQNLIENAQTALFPYLESTETNLKKNIQQLILSADQFVVNRNSILSPSKTNRHKGHSIIAGYHWFGDWGRDTMISLPGLTLSTGRLDICESILRTFAKFVDHGMLPNRFPDEGQEPEYNTVDATLWFFVAVHAHYQFTSDPTLVRELYPVLKKIIDWHLKGTRYHIRIDREDHLLYSGEPGVQLTWMDAKVGNWVVTPRIGKPVEVNALWYNAVCMMLNCSKRLRKPYKKYQELAEKIKISFQKFWNDQYQYCFDVIDGPNGNEEELRPNQIFAVSLPYSVLTETQAKAVVDVCTRKLLTPHGLRSLSPDSDEYQDHYGGPPLKRDGAYHQGTVWSWLIGPFIEAYLKVYQNPDKAEAYLQPLMDHLREKGLGTISEIFDGEPPFTPRGCIAQAWSVAEVLRALNVVYSWRQKNTWEQ